MDCSPPGSSVHEILQYWSGLPFPSPGHLPNPGIEPASPVSPALAGGFFTTEPLVKPLIVRQGSSIFFLLSLSVNFLKAGTLLILLSAESQILEV